MTEEHGIAAGLGGLDLNSLLSAAQDMQTQMVESQRALAETVVEGQSGGGAVTIAVTGGLEFRRRSGRPRRRHDARGPRPCGAA